MLEIDFINVGYGDSTLIREMEHGRPKTTMLVDVGDMAQAVGAKGSRVSCAQFLHKKAVREIDLLVLSHLHKDHIGGLLEVVERFPVKTLLTTYVPPAALRPVQKQDWASPDARSLALGIERYTRALERLNERGTQIFCLQNSHGELRLSEELHLQFQQGWRGLERVQKEILDRLLGACAPLPGEEELIQLDGFINNMSIVLWLRYRGVCTLLPGDVYLNHWEGGAPAPLCDIVKVPHHGRFDAMDEGLLEALAPAHAVISVSNDRSDNCPDPALCRLLAERTSLHYTDDFSEPPGSSAHPSVAFCIDEEGLVHAGAAEAKRVARKAQKETDAR